MDHPPQILEIYRDFLIPGREPEFRAVEEDAARICAEFECPHPHLAIESLTGPTEVWWLNGFRSEAHRQQVVQDYAANRALSEALTGISRRREGLVGAPIDLLAKHRPDLSDDVGWTPAGARFFVVAETKQDPSVAGTVFEAPDATRFVFRSFATREEADSAASVPGAETRVFAVRPYWGMPADQWIAADPEFWSTNPMASRRRVADGSRRGMEDQHR